MPNRNAPPGPNAFAGRAREVADGLELAFVRAGEGGYPLLLVHGWPETKRIWWRNIEPLARGRLRGDRPRPARLRRLGPRARRLLRSGRARPRPARARARRARPRALRGRRAATSAAWSIQDLGLRFEGFVERQCLFNTVLPAAARGVRARPASRAAIPREDARWPPTTSCARAATPTSSPPSSTRPTSAAATSRSSTARASGPRRAPSTATTIDFMTEPFADADKLRAGFGIYESALGTRPLSEPPRFFETQPDADAGALRAGGPRDPARLPRALRGRVHRAHRPVRRPARRPLPAVGASRRAQPGSDLLPRAT